MASGRIVDPMTLLRVTPLVTSTAAVMFSADQYLFLDTLLAPPHRERANELVPSYFKTFFGRGIWIILTAYPLSIATGVANVYLGGSSGSGSSVAAKLSSGSAAARWYAAGAALALAHFAFVPSIMYKIQALNEGEGKGEGNKNLKRWLDVHLMRSVLVDVPSWLCFATACLKSLGPQ
ncbi:hypothetical protein PG996_012855 [Apiospora saccharicola]|uniref:Integral membrane protein n=1 Tax=Apiospora saccharicola TaxID=335842 RepID=A0ABR1U6K2_9PEZI